MIWVIILGTVFLMALMVHVTSVPGTMNASKELMIVHKGSRFIMIGTVCLVVILSTILLIV